MTVDLVFNELSFNPASATVQQAIDKMSSFVDLVKDARLSGCGGLLRVPKNFRFEGLAPDYTVDHWLVDSRVDRDKRSYLGALALKLPYFDGIPGSPAADRFDHSEFLIDGERADGFGVSFLIDGIAISLFGEPPWSERFFSIIYRTIDEESGQVVDSEVSIRHISKVGDATLHLSEITDLRLMAIRNGRELWDLSPEIFDRITFCAAVEPQMQGLTLGAGGLRTVIRTFREIQAVCENWKVGSFDSAWIAKTSQEGPSTLNKYSAERTFTKPDGTDEVFSWHIKRGDLRIYFIPQADTHRFLVGYIGPHLPTVRFSG